MYKGRSFLSLEDVSAKDIDVLFTKTQKIIKSLKQGKKLNALAGKVIALLFFEPSSRTFSSFSSAAQRLGAHTIEHQDMTKNSSTVKGESLEDTIRTIESYSDGIVMRHFETGAAKRAAAISSVPIINAGDGKGEHPTQALLDLFTIYKHFGKLSGLTVVFAGDLLNGRTVHSLSKGLSLYKNNTLYLLSPKSLKLPDEFIKKYLKGKVKVVEIHSDKDIPPDANVWYWTRVQKERFASAKEYEKVKNSFVLTPELLAKKGNKKLILMHPLPRVNEIDVRVDSDPRVKYFEQMKNGLYVRMALLSMIFGK